MEQEFFYVIDTLISEGYADDEKSAAAILEAMSDEWLDAILDEKYVRALDIKRKGPDHRIRRGLTRRGPSVPDKYKYWEGAFTPGLSSRSPQARRRKEQRRASVGGFKA